MFKKIDIQGFIMMMNFPHEEDIDENGEINANQVIPHPCLLLAMENFENEKIIYASYGTSKIEKNEHGAFLAGPDYKNFGLNLQTKWFINVHKIIRVKLDENLSYKKIGKITNKNLLLEINKHANKSHILNIINFLHDAEINKVPFKMRNHHRFWP